MTFVTLFCIPPRRSIFLRAKLSHTTPPYTRARGLGGHKNIGTTTGGPFTSPLCPPSAGARATYGGCARVRVCAGRGTRPTHDAIALCAHYARHSSSEGAFIRPLASQGIAYGEVAPPRRRLATLAMPYRGRGKDHPTGVSASEHPEGVPSPPGDYPCAPAHVFKKNTRSAFGSTFF